MQTFLLVSVSSKSSCHGFVKGHAFVACTLGPVLLTTNLVTTSTRLIISEKVWNWSTVVVNLAVVRDENLKSMLWHVHWVLLTTNLVTTSTRLIFSEKVWNWSTVVNLAVVRDDTWERIVLLRFSSLTTDRLTTVDQFQTNPNNLRKGLA